jgi:hypothetical protein
VQSVIAANPSMCCWAAGSMTQPGWNRHVRCAWRLENPEGVVKELEVGKLVFCACMLPQYSATAHHHSKGLQTQVALRRI